MFGQTVQTRRVQEKKQVELNHNNDGRCEFGYGYFCFVQKHMENYNTNDSYNLVPVKIFTNKLIFVHKRANKH